MLFAPRCRRAPNEKAVICFCSCLYQVLSHILDVSLPPSACLNPLCRHPPLPPRRSPLVLRLFALALADGSGLPFSLYPPLAALESQTPQREARALPCRALMLPKCEVQKLSPPGAGCPHPSRRLILYRRATFPKGKAKRSCAVHKISTVSTGKPRLAPRVLQYVFLHKNNRLILA